MTILLWAALYCVPIYVPMPTPILVWVCPSRPAMPTDFRPPRPPGICHEEAE